MAGVEAIAGTAASIFRTVAALSYVVGRLLFDTSAMLRREDAVLARGLECEVTELMSEREGEGATEEVGQNQKQNRTSRKAVFGGGNCCRCWRAEGWIWGGTQDAQLHTAYVTDSQQESGNAIHRGHQQAITGNSGD